MSQKNRQCQNCKQQFTIEPEDFDFYKKIDVPPPTWCPDCRLQRRFIFRNERTLYKRTCDMCHEHIIAMYPSDVPFPVYCQTCWWSDKWDAADYGQDYDFTRPFFNQYQELYNKVPRINFLQRNDTNCLYSNYTYESKNTYLSHSMSNVEEVYYSRAIDNSKEVYDCLSASNLNSCYGGMYFAQSHNSHFLFRSTSCIDSWFLFDCTDCQDCILSSNLRHRKYVIRNVQYSKEEYAKKLAEMNFGSYAFLEECKKEFQKLLESSIHRYADLYSCTNCTGDGLSNSKNAKHCFEAWEFENTKYIIRGYHLKDCMDLDFTLGSERIYEYVSGGRDDADLKFSVGALSNVRNAQYSDSCGSSHDLFGCVALRNKEYCILNKKYSEEEYKTMLPRMIEQMNTMPYVDQGGRTYLYGEFFPPETSPFAYNETLAQEYFPLSREEVSARKLRWRDGEAKTVQSTKQAKELVDHISEVDDKIVEEIIRCEHEGNCHEQCTLAFKIIPQELTFYRQKKLPLPRLCPNCRHFERLKLRNPAKLWNRSCMCQGTSERNTTEHFHGKTLCPKNFETSYPPDRPEIVYCEQCYNSEVV